MRFKDKVVVVLGGNSGIGLASAQLCRRGAKVRITGRHRETLDAAEAEMPGCAASAPTSPTSGDGRGLRRDRRDGRADRRAVRQRRNRRLRAAARDHRGRVGPGSCGQPQGLRVRAAEGAAADGPGRLGGGDRLDRRARRARGQRHLCRGQGRALHGDEGLRQGAGAARASASTWSAPGRSTPRCSTAIRG